MRHPARRPIALTLGALLLAAVPAQAGPVEYRDVVSHSSPFGRGVGPSVDLRLRSFTQQQGKSAGQPASIAGIAQDTKTGGPDTSGEGAATAAPNTGGPLTGTTVPAQDQQTTVETIELGEVDGTLCDCGEIKIPGGGFPLWPLLGFAGIPLFFIPEDNPPEEFPTPTPTPPSTPTPTPPQVPEPATLLLFGSGLAALGAGARRRRAQKSKIQQAAREV